MGSPHVVDVKSDSDITYLRAEYYSITRSMWVPLPGNRLPDNPSNRKRLKDLFDSLGSPVNLRVVYYKSTEQRTGILIGSDTTDLEDWRDRSPIDE